MENLSFFQLLDQHFEKASKKRFFLKMKLS
jgi:hypothetical protein